MFASIVVLACICMWLAVELYWQAQRVEASLDAAREQARRSHEYLRAQLPKGCVNVRKTVAVNYSEGLPNDHDWDDDLDKTQALPSATDHDSGMRPKVKG